MTVAEPASVERAPVRGHFWRELRLLGNALLIYLGAFLVTGIVVGIAKIKDVGGGDVSSNPASTPLLLASIVGGLATAAFILRRMPRTSGVALRDLGVRPLRSRDWATIAIGVGATLLVKFALGYLLVATGNGHHRQAGFEHLHVSTVAAAASFFLATALVAPFCEELFFRLLLFRTLSEKMPWLLAATISALLFGVAHGDRLLFPTLAAMGFVNALAYRQSGNIFTAVAIHVANNSVAAIALSLG